MDEAVANLIETYHEVNAAIIDELSEEPSLLEFMRYVARNRPFVVRHAATSWKATQAWDAAYLTKKMEGREVKVAVTPHGNADAVVEQEDGRVMFVEPHETSESFKDFLRHILQPASKRSNGNVKYAQTQNDNLRNEYEELYADVPKDIAFARIALEQEADAINLWLGDDLSVTSLHKDNYENIYIQIRGQKHFVLLPPVEMPCVNEQMLPKGRYTPRGDDHSTLTVSEDQDSEKVPVAVWDPDEPGQHTTAYSRLSKPLRVTLRPGDMLYLPAMWYHKVSQSVGEEGFVCAVNYWYDMDWTGGFYAGNNFIRDVFNEGQKRPEYPNLETDGT